MVETSQSKGAATGEKQSHCKGKSKKNGGRRVGAGQAARCAPEAERAMIAAVAPQRAAPRPDDRGCCALQSPASLC